MEPVGEGSTEASVAVGEGPPVTLTDVRLAAHGEFDRIVFEVAGEGEAGWRVAWADDPRAQGSGAPVEVPHDYYPDNDPTRMPPNRWRSHAHLLYGNWVNEIYQSTLYELDAIGR